MKWSVGRARWRTRNYSREKEEEEKVSFFFSFFLLSTRKVHRIQSFFKTTEMSQSFDFFATLCPSHFAAACWHHLLRNERHSFFLLTFYWEDFVLIFFISLPFYGWKESRNIIFPLENLFSQKKHFNLLVFLGFEAHHLFFYLFGTSYV